MKIDKEECDDTCPIPLELIPEVEKGITKISYNEKTKIAKIEYDEHVMSEDQIIHKLLKIGYTARK